MPGKLKIVDYTWNIADQYDMISALRDHCEFYHVTNIRRQWDNSVRPVPDVLKFVPYYQPGLYDLAILHLDQQAIDPKNKQVLVYNEFNNCIADIPKIVINHGSPVYPEWFTGTGSKLTDRKMSAECVREIKALVGENIMVVASNEACSEREWGWGIPIIPGMDPVDWPDLRKEPRAFTALPPYELDHYYNRDCMMNTAEILYERHGHILIYAGLNSDSLNNAERYRKYLGKSLLYVDTSIRTPNNRARTEAFLAGCCVIQVEGAHDLEYWAKPGENIVIVPNVPATIAAIITDYLENRYNEALAIGQRGKEMAVKTFSPQLSCKKWLELFSSLV